MGINPRLPAGTERQTNSLAGIALALALLPSLAAIMVVVVIRSSNDEMFEALVRNGASHFVCNCQGWGIAAFLAAVVATFRRPGKLSDFAIALTFANRFFYGWLFCMTPHRLK